MKRNFVYLLIGISFVSFGFLSGYWLGEMIYRDTAEPMGVQKIAESIETDVPEEIVQVQYQLETPLPTPIDISYVIYGEDDKIDIYMLENQQKKLIKSYEVSLDMFPREDKELLLDGISVSTKENAFEIVENFIS